MEGVQLVLVALVTGIITAVIGPFVLTRLQGQQRVADARLAADLKAAEKEQDWARQDELARRVTAAAAAVAEDSAALLKENKKATALLAFANKHVVTTVERLEVIHDLVNSNMTSQMQSELDGLKRELALLNEIIAGRDTPRRATLEAITTAEARIVDMTEAIRRRLVDQRAKTST